MDLYIKILLIILAPVIGGLVYGFERVVIFYNTFRVFCSKLEQFYY